MRRETGSPKILVSENWLFQSFTAVKRLGTRVNTRVIYVLPVTFPLHPTKFPRSTSATRAISVLSSIILPLQTFFSQVLLLRQQHFGATSEYPSTPFTCVGALWRTRYITIVAILIQWDANKLKRSDFLKHLAIKNCEKTILKNI